MPAGAAERGVDERSAKEFHQGRKMVLDPCVGTSTRAKVSMLLLKSHQFVGNKVYRVIIGVAGNRISSV